MTEGFGNDLSKHHLLFSLGSRVSNGDSYSVCMFLSCKVLPVIKDSY